MLLRFERDPGDTLQAATLAQLQQSVTTGVLDLEQAAIRQPDAEDLHQLADPFRDFVGPQSTTGNAWVRRMRLHQSWWRTFRLRARFGYGPNRGSIRRYGNMLDDDGATRGLNFLTDDARRSFEERLASHPVGVDPWRTGRNPLASQPLAFNLFGHLRHNRDLAAPLLHSLLATDVPEVTEVEIERLSDALGDKTAFDALIRYVRADGSPACVAVETKLTEPLSQQPYDWLSYASHSAFDATAWTTSDPDVLGDPRWSQLWRNHLLARAEIAKHPDLGPVTVLVVHHRDDPHCTANVDAYRAMLVDPDVVRCVDLGQIVEDLTPIVAGQPRHEQWVADLHDRYADLSLSSILEDLR